MTAVVGIAESGKVWIGADSAMSDDMGGIQILRAPKVFRVGNLLFGCAGSIRVMNLLRAITWPKHPRGVSAYDYVAVHVSLTIRKALHEAGALCRAYEGAPDEMPEYSELLVGYKGNLFRMQSDFSVVEAADDCDAAGLGAASALPLLEGTGEPKARIISALKSAAKRNWSVRGPFKVEVI
jgi:hypothetical protein